MTCRLMPSFVRCSIPRVSSIYRSRFYSTAPLISRNLILTNPISKPCCAISIKSASSNSLATENDKIKRGDENLLRVFESVMAEKELKKALPKDFQFEIIDNPGDDRSIILKREYGGEQIQAEVFMDYKHRIEILVTIDKKVGRTLEFWCKLTPNDFEIEDMSLKSSENSNKDGHHLFGSDGRLRRAFQEYFAARGLKKSLYDCLHYRMEQMHFPWQRLKEFIEK